MIAIAQTIALCLGALLVLASLGKYIQRSGNWHGIWQIWIGQLKDFNVAEYRLFRSAVLILLFAVVLRIINLTLNG
ncbi:hypothetical protein [Ferrimonas senticii]|uniref:hypothetical protein n=1 Tax=Ferrimonas senticii TaxID=394566 RepID=UPI0003FDB10A|nr:hypothetical protein [Ferrimonas senticii]